jgi:hypothetical protein
VNIWRETIQLPEAPRKAPRTAKGKKRAAQLEAQQAAAAAAGASSRPVQCLLLHHGRANAPSATATLDVSSFLDAAAQQRRESFDHAKISVHRRRWKL